MQLLVAAKYTTGPETVLSQIGLLDKLFVVDADQRRSHDERQAWGYLKFVSLSPVQVNDILAETQNPFTRSRLTTIKEVVDRGGITDDFARQILAVNDLIAHDSQRITLSQAGLLGGKPRARLNLELDKIREIERGISEKPST